MFGGIIQRMIWWELVKVFSLCFVAITGLLLMGSLFAEATRSGLDPSQILTVIPLLIPSTLPYTLPATCLFATCVVYGRLSHDNEILAIKAAGINILRVVGPCVLLGLLASGAAGALYYDTIPSTHHWLRTRILADIEEYLYSELRKGNLQHPKVNYVIWVKKVEGRTLRDAEFQRRDAKGNPDLTARAQKAELRVDLAKKQIVVKMFDCHIRTTDPNEFNGFIKYKEWPVDLPEFESNRLRDSHLTWPELLERRSLLHDEVAAVQAEIDSHRAVIALNNAPAHYPAHVKNLESKMRERRQWLASVEGEIHMRPSLALGCLCFVLVGCPVGIWFSRSDYLSAFITCFLPIVFIYYPLLLCGINTGKSGKLTPVVSIWAANALMGLAALVLYRKLLKN